MRQCCAACQALEGFLEKFGDGQELANPLVVIPTFNNGRDVLNLVSQLSNHGLDRYFLLDGGSTDRETVLLLGLFALEGRVGEIPSNPGPLFYAKHRSFYEKLPDVFCVTDPDLQFNPRLPRNFMKNLFTLTEEFEVGKAGFALSIDGVLDQRTLIAGRFYSVTEWESKFWQTPRANSLGLEVFEAPLDTTFAVYNKRFFQATAHFDAVRVAGDYAAKHLPWFAVESTNGANDVGPASNWTAGAAEARIEYELRTLQGEINALKQSLSWKITEPLRRIAGLL